ncbi:MAG: ATP-binding protein [Bacteroidales bacterium]
MKRYFCLLLLILSTNVFAQQRATKLEEQMLVAQGEELVKIKIELGNEYAKIDPERALELGLEAAFLAKKGSNPLLEGHALLLMGLSSYNANHSENALRYYNRALAHFEKYGYTNEQVISLQGISEVYSSARNFDMAANFLNKAIKIARQANDESFQVKLHQHLGDIFLSQNNFTRAYQEYVRVNELLGNEENLKPDNVKQKIETYRKIGSVYRNIGQVEQSLLAYRRAADISHKNDLTSEKIADYHQIAYSLFLMNELDSSLSYYNKVLAFYQLQNDTVPMIGVLIEIGDVFFDKHQYSQAVATNNRAYELAVATQMVQEQVTAFVNISRYFMAFGDYPSSTDYLNRALDIAIRENLTNSAANVYKYLSGVKEEEGRYHQALEYYKLWADLRDSIYSEESGQNLAQMQILYDITQKERENEILRQNSEIQTLQISKSQYQLIVLVSLALFLFALLVLFFFFYNNKKKEFVKQKETEQRILEMNKTLEKRMISEIKKQEKQQLLLAQKSKLESLGTLAAGIAHEINQPLGGISMGLDNVLIRLSEKNLSDEYLKGKVNLMFENVDRIKRIIEHTRTFSRAHKQASFERIDLNSVLNNALLMVKAQFASHQVELEVNLDPTIEQVIADKFKLEQVVLNLLSNAKFSVEQKKQGLGASFNKQIEISTSQDNDFVYISVRDNGIGINEKNIERIFDPFYTTKKVDKGTGLGLSIAYGFIKDILGDIAIESKEGEYAQFDVKIPKS